MLQFLSHIPSYEPQETDSLSQMETKLKNQKVGRPPPCSQAYTGTGGTEHLPELCPQGTLALPGPQHLTLRMGAVSPPPWCQHRAWPSMDCLSRLAEPTVTVPHEERLW